MEQKRENLIVRSPIDGQVLLPWDAEQSLMHRPVVTGQRVMTIADPSQDWELELAMPERRMGHVMRAVDEFGPNLDVSYISAGDPRSPKYGNVKEIYGIDPGQGRRGSHGQDHGGHRPEDLFKPSPGTTVTAKVKCGRCSLGYAWFHEAIEWVQKHILF